MQNYKKGFTLIELLVVIAIIGLLSAVVLASLNSARSKGSDASIKGSLSSIRSQAELYYDNNSLTYGAQAIVGDTCDTAGTGVFSDTQVRAAIGNAESNAGTAANPAVQSIGAIASSRIACFANGTSFVVGVIMKSDNTQVWCVSNLGAKQVPLGSIDTAGEFVAATCR